MNRDKSYFSAESVVFQSLDQRGQSDGAETANSDATVLRAVLGAVGLVLWAIRNGHSRSDYLTILNTDAGV